MSEIHREAACYHNLGKVFQSVGDYTTAKGNFNKVIVIQRKLVIKNEKRHPMETSGMCYPGYQRLFSRAAGRDVLQASVNAPNMTNSFK